MCTKPGNIQEKQDRARRRLCAMTSVLEARDLKGDAKEFLGQFPFPLSLYHKEKKKKPHQETNKTRKHKHGDGSYTLLD